MKKQFPKTKRLTEAKRKHLKTVKRKQLSEIKKSIKKYLNEGEARAAHLKNQQDRYGSDAKWGKMVPPPGYSDGSQRIPNFQSLDDLNRTLISFELNPINIQNHNRNYGVNYTEGTLVGQVNDYFAYNRLGLEVNNLIDSIYYPDEETRANAFADPEDQIDDRIALQNFNHKKYPASYKDHPFNEIKKSIKKFQRLNENEGFDLVNDISLRFKDDMGWYLDMKTIKDWIDEYYTDSTAYKFGTKEFEDLMDWLKRKYIEGGGPQDDPDAGTGKGIQSVYLYRRNGTFINRAGFRDFYEES